MSFYFRRRGSTTVLPADDLADWISNVEVLDYQLAALRTKFIRPSFLKIDDFAFFQTKDLIMTLLEISYCIPISTLCRAVTSAKTRHVILKDIQYYLLANDNWADFL